MTKRYLLCPGLVRSQTDGDLHYVNAAQLVRLYGVTWADCRLALERPDKYPTSLIRLRPRYDGDYTLPTK